MMYKTPQSQGLSSKEGHHDLKPLSASYEWQSAMERRKCTLFSLAKGNASEDWASLLCGK